ncbi:SDR family NAD(P)-dependent oxidoreductase [Phenylobacterium sp. LjRoot225]|uniref:SDR family oxidoreductase n=1 Tax=Phenylobacterium sp. LjRoot225 TaxID=3342285 RepID=UPI003ED04C09
MEDEAQTEGRGPLAGRVALVTGASSGIGEGAALALAAAGAAVAVTARRADRLVDLARRITEAGGTALALPGDAGDEAVAAGVVAQTLERFGRLDILVNSAGIIREGGVEGADTAEWRQVLEVNLLACLYFCKAALGPMKAQGRGDIINITSLAARQAGGPFGSYGVSKFGLAAITEGLRQEVGGSGIRVCAIEPGATATEVAEGVKDPNLRQFLRDYVARDGGMKPEDVADAIVFVVSLPPRANVSRLRIRPTIDTVAHPAMATNEGFIP